MTAARITEPFCAPPIPARQIAPPPRPAGSQTTFASLLCEAFEKRSVRYCIWHSAQDLPDGPDSDLDICVHPEDRPAVRIAFGDLWRAGIRLVQCMHYTVGGFYFVFEWPNGRARSSACLDMVFEYWRNGLFGPDVKEAIRSRERNGPFWIASPDFELAYLLSKRACKGMRSIEQSQRLRAVAESVGIQRSAEIVARTLPGTKAQEAAAACIDATARNMLRRARRKAWLHVFTRHPTDLCRFLARDVVRRAGRLATPTGLLVAVLGTDGAGKSSLIARLDSDVGKAFRRVRRFHWAPRVIPRLTEPIHNTNPHSKPARGSFLSCCVLPVFILDYWLSWIFDLWTLRRRSGLILFDRYFHDVLVDPRRYRYGGPAWFARCMAHLVPSPDLVLILDADERAVMERKAELPFGEIARQRSEYKRLRFARGKTFSIDTGEGKEATAEKAAKAIFDYLARRFETQHGEWLPPGPICP